mmetsp:Transcript_33260/g.105171  ORF Transcript_33260/g.105171 Transcript_33260/m.105171 type:complete len:205 (-) Transcript_33260:917-1531(-)
MNSPRHHRCRRVTAMSRTKGVSTNTCRATLALPAISSVPLHIEALRGKTWDATESFPGLLPRTRASAAGEDSPRAPLNIAKSMRSHRRRCKNVRTCAWSLTAARVLFRLPSKFERTRRWMMMLGTPTARTFPTILTMVRTRASSTRTLPRLRDPSTSASGSRASGAHARKRDTTEKSAPWTHSSSVQMNSSRAPAPVRLRMYGR